MNLTFISAVLMKEETDATDSILGRTVDFELCAQYLWKWHTTWKTRPPEERAPGLVPRLSEA